MNFTAAVPIFRRGVQIPREGVSPEAEARDIERISGFAHLTPGDFAAVARQHRFRPILTTADLAERLAEETAAKLLAGGATRSKIGFC